MKEKCDKTELNKIAAEITPEVLKELNKLLDGQKPEKLIALLECFVALLRNREKADHIDVKLYLSDHEKLEYKLKNIDEASLDPNYVKLHADRLK